MVYRDGFSYITQNDVVLFCYCISFAYVIDKKQLKHIYFLI